MKAKNKANPSTGNQLVTKKHLTSELAPIKSRLGKVEVSLTNLEVDFGEMKTDMKEMKALIHDGFSHLDKFLGHLTKIEDENASQKNCNDRLSDGFEDHGRRIKKLEAEVFAE